MYMAVCMLSNHAYEHIDDVQPYMGEQFAVPRSKPLKYLKKASPEAYAYAIKVDRLLTRLDS